MAYIFKETELPSLISVVPGRERIFFVNQELASIDDMLAGVMHYKKGAASPCTCTRIASISISSSTARRRWNPTKEPARLDPAI